MAEEPTSRPSEETGELPDTIEGLTLRLKRECGTKIVTLVYYRSWNVVVQWGPHRSHHEKVLGSGGFRTAADALRQAIKRWRRRSPARPFVQLRSKYGGPPD